MEEKVLSQNNNFLKQSFGKAVFPCMLTVLSANINVFVDGMLVGNRIGSDALAAINLSLPVFLFMCVIGSFFASGTAINASHEIGRNRHDTAIEYYRTCIASLFVMSLLFTIVGLAFRQELVDFLCTDEGVQGYIMEYIIITLIGALPKIMIYIPLWYLRLDGKNISVMVMMGVLSIGNVILDIVMVYVMDMGVFGAGLASVVATTIAFLIGVGCLLRKDSTFTFKPYFIKEKNKWKKIASAGIPSAFNNLASTVRLLMINLFLFDIGGGILVAVFSAVNGIYGIGEAIVLGVPQAASPIIGMQVGEQDYDSNRLLIRIEYIWGMMFCAIYMALIIAFNVPIQKVYNLSEPLQIPLIIMTVSVFFGLAGSIMQGYYNVANKNILANGLILLRLIIMPFVGLLFVKHTGFPPFLFLVIGEAGAFLIWYIVTGIIHYKRPELSRYMLINEKQEKQGSVLNFSVENDPVKICEASERISDFCAENGLSMKNTMALQLAIEELLAFISSINTKNNTGNDVYFDLRAYSISDVKGIRIRYNGLIFNPFDEKYQDDDMMMGVQMIKKLVEVYEYTKTVGFNTLLIVLKE